MTEFPIKWSCEDLRIKLPKRLTIRWSRKKRNEAENNCFMDSGNTYNKSPLLSKAQFIRRAAAVPNQIGRIKFGSSTRYESSLID